jgi:hypothetical protein
VALEPAKNVFGELEAVAAVTPQVNGYHYSGRPTRWEGTGRIRRTGGILVTLCSRLR